MSSIYLSISLFIYSFFCLIHLPSIFYDLCIIIFLFINHLYVYKYTFIHTANFLYVIYQSPVCLFICILGTIISNIYLSIILLSVIYYMFISVYFYLPDCHLPIYVSHLSIYTSMYLSMLLFLYQCISNLCISLSTFSLCIYAYHLICLSSIICVPFYHLCHLTSVYMFIYLYIFFF